MKKVLYLLSAIFLISCGNINFHIIKNIGASEFQKLINEEEGIIIDVRIFQEFYSGHIKGIPVFILFKNTKEFFRYFGVIISRIAIKKNLIYDQESYRYDHYI